MGKHTHTPDMTKWRINLDEPGSPVDGRVDYVCSRCGKWIVWIRPLPNRAGHWRAA